MLARLLANLRAQKRLDRLHRRSNVRPALVTYRLLQTLLDVPAPRSGAGRVAFFGESVLERISRDDTLTTGNGALVKK
jgi:hypothetical protein